MNYEWTIGKQGFWKPYFYELRLDGILVDSGRFWTARQATMAIVTHEAAS